MIPKIRRLLVWIFVMGLAYFLYSSCRHAGFIWDDQFLVVKNPLIRSPILVFETFRHFLGDEPPSNFYRPVQTLTYLVDYWRGGIDPAIYHDGSVLLHGLNGVLLSIFISGFLRRESAISEKSAALSGLLVALIWLAHPIHSATVAYIAGRADSLALLFLLASWCFWDLFLRSAGKRKTVFGCLVGLCGFLAICSKEAALLGVAIFLGWAFLPGNSLSRERKAAVFASCLFLAGLYLCLRMTIGPGEASQATGSQGDRPNLVIRALGDYFRMMIYPGNLRMERQVVMVPNLFRDPADFDPVYPFLAIAGILFLGLLAISVFRKGAMRRIRGFGVFWFLLSILPVSNVFALNATVAEHWLYIPSIGVLLILVGWVLETTLKTRRFFVAAALLAIIALTVRTKKRVEDWASPIVFFESTIRDGGDTARIRVNLANEYQLQGDLEKGEEMLRSVLVLNPNYAQARHALIVNLTIQGRGAEASALYSEEENPFGSSYRGQLYRLQRLTSNDQIPEALAAVKDLKTQRPDSWLLTVEIGRLLDKMGRTEQKEMLYQNFAENHWWHAESHVELAKLCERNREPRKAAEYYLDASRLDIRDSALKARAAGLLAQTMQSQKPTR